MGAQRSTDGVDPLDFGGRVAIVTGGAGASGGAIAEAFLAAGADVMVCGRTEIADGALPEAPDGPVTVRRAGFFAADMRDPTRRRHWWRPPSGGTGAWTCWSTTPGVRPTPTPPPRRPG